MKIILGTLLLIFSLSFFTTFADDQISSEKNDSFNHLESDARWDWYSFDHNDENDVKGIVVVVHGLNTNPLKMKGIIDLFTDHHFEAMNVTLSGHGGNLSVFKTVTREMWLRDLYHGYCLAKEKAKRLNVPLYFSGFSVGGLIGIDLLTDINYPDVFFDKILLIAPALSVNNITYLVRAFNIFTPQFVLPSANSKSYRANISGTSIAAYNSLFNSLSLVQERSLEKANVPTLVLVDPKDELVNSDGLLKLIDNQQLTQWTLKLINNNESLLDTSYHHLMIDYDSVGAKNWEIMKSQISNFLEKAII